MKLAEVVEAAETEVLLLTMMMRREASESVASNCEGSNSQAVCALSSLPFPLPHNRLHFQHSLIIFSSPSFFERTAVSVFGICGEVDPLIMSAAGSNFTSARLQHTGRCTGTTQPTRHQNVPPPHIFTIPSSPSCVLRYSSQFVPAALPFPSVAVSSRTLPSLTFSEGAHHTNTATQNATKLFLPFAYTAISPSAVTLASRPEQMPLRTCTASSVR